MKWKITAGLLVAACAAFGQTPGGRPAFEVASIKVAEPITSKISADGKLRIGTVIEGNRVEIIFASLADIIRQAYRLKPYQFQGPDWMSSERYDIRAKMPDGANKDQVPEMMQMLLEERFKLSFHKDSKEHNVYALVTTKGGIKLKEVEPDPPADANGTTFTAPAAAGGGAPMRLMSPMAGAPVSAAGERAMVTARSMDGTKTVMTGGPGMHVDRKMTMTQFGDFLSRFVDRPVIDMTELKATYQVVLDIPGEEILKMARSGGGGNMIVINGTGGPLPLGAGDSASDPSSDSAMFSTVQQMGLKLEKRKSQMDVLVAERAEKVPVE